MKMGTKSQLEAVVAGWSVLLLVASAGTAADNLTSKPPATPRINGARVFGVRPESSIEAAQTEEMLGAIQSAHRKSRND
jgi:hypothetical protein